VQAVGGAALSSDEIQVTGKAQAPRMGDQPAAEPAGPDETTADQPGPAANQRPDQPAPARRRPIGILAAVSAFVLVVDIVTKQLAVSQLSDREPVRLLGGAIYLDLIRNSGAAFSLGTRYTFVFPLITALVVAWIGWTARRLRSVPWAIALGLVLGGALGNFTDRIFRAPGPMVGHVIDFISVFGPEGQHFPVFNAADSALCVGVGLAVLLELTGRRVDGTRTQNRDPVGVPDSARG
jgi:signal peptidase II